MSEVVAESVQTQSDGTLWAITVQTVDEGDFGFEVESQVKAPDSISWRSLDVVGPFKRRERQKFCVHGIIGARQTGASNEHEHQTQFS